MYAHECKIFTFNILPTKSKLETKKSLSGPIFEGNLHILLSQIDLAGACRLSAPDWRRTDIIQAQAGQLNKVTDYSL